MLECVACDDIPVVVVNEHTADTVYVAGFHQSLPASGSHIDIVILSLT